MATIKIENQAKQSNEAVPIFLRKTYHMIDTCDVNVACWSNDGETFIVKNTEIFEKSIIPQFFKHSKFSSFVRQLNFYGFRKIKYADTIKIDAKLEAETANFWRFRHEKFIRGKPELLIDIKRSNGHQGNAVKKVSPNIVKSSEDASILKNEVTTLKQRIEAMTRNIDELTSMVHQVTLKQEEQENETNCSGIESGVKRKKREYVSEVHIKPDNAISATGVAQPEDICMDSNPFPPLPTPELPSRNSSTQDSAKLSDDDFVEQLFTQFGDDDDMAGLLDEVPIPESPQSSDIRAESTEKKDNIPECTDRKDNTPECTDRRDNTPDPKLMNRLSDALGLLPRAMQEMVVDRLVANIVGTESIEKNVNAVSALSYASKPSKDIFDGKTVPNQVPVSPSFAVRPSPDQQTVPMPLAAATLAALLTQYTSVQGQNGVIPKNLPPVIPVNA
mmetsp:Transcript_32087/g.36482  ORF Transcript_32087/g.36482 Transcript_32087/m.36482 type:complete len:446 (-) Transcript_32087:75-1412(-)|eukprot:CAMPEP_0194133652 /NCGR_PEP_ID=MMETSP0152-20130528/3734_1 /TAXON_ID=1049557 /ORGANISM="Thalassiothrix antarctica, Strain L6-D1" /LENGTH=445 /DNA_ID=CAMNT_0038828995 /DNA_START=131 /DNA_END=1468 /DNA_ORIENTATION=+